MDLGIENKRLENFLTRQKYSTALRRKNKKSQFPRKKFRSLKMILIIALVLITILPPVALKLYYLIQETRISHIFKEISPCGLLAGKVVLITGATKGLGNSLFWRMSDMKAHVIGTGRSRERLQSVFPASATFLEPNSTLDMSSKDGKTFTGAMDLSSLRRVDDFVNLLVKLNISIDILINNAAFLGPNERSAENYEMTFATNYLAHYYLTRRLIETNRLPKGGRCIFVVSNFYRTLSVSPKELAMLPHKVWGNLEWFDAYKTTKFLLVALTNTFSRVYKDQTFLAVHPGELHTGIMRNLPGFVGSILRLVSYLWLPSANMGADLVLHSVCDPNLTARSGDYLENCIAHAVTPAAADVDFQHSLLSFSEALTNERSRG